MACSYCWHYFSVGSPAHLFENLDYLTRSLLSPCDFRLGWVSADPIHLIDDNLLCENFLGERDANKRRPALRMGCGMRKEKTFALKKIYYYVHFAKVYNKYLFFFQFRYCIFYWPFPSLSVSLMGDYYFANNLIKYFLCKF